MFFLLFLLIFFSQTIKNLKAKLSDLHTAHRSLSDDSEKKKKHYQECFNSAKVKIKLYLIYITVWVIYVRHTLYWGPILAINKPLTMTFTAY